MMSEPQNPLGKLATAADERDAVHVAIIPGTSEVTVHPGQHVRLVDGKFEPTQKIGTGIVDPFLMQPAFPGDRFYVVLWPNTVTGMRHHWEHPEFDGLPPIASSVDTSDIDGADARRFIEEAASKCGLSVDRFQDIVTEWAANGADPICEHGSEDMRDGWDSIDLSKFWPAAKELWGLDSPDEDELTWYSPFTCSC